MAGNPPGAGGDAGNYKGVMLCNRPMEASSAPRAPGPQHLQPQMDAPRFRPVGLPAEQIGLNPAKENTVCNVLAMEKEAARRRAENPSDPGPENFMVKHRRWLADIAKKKALLNDELQEAAIEAEQRRERFTEHARSKRLARKQGTMQLQEPSSAPVSYKPCEPVTYTAPAPAPTYKASSSSKPKWAMTEDAADAADDDEAAELVDFASGLDYDNYIDDLEVRQALSVIKERIDHEKAVQAVAERAEQAAEEAAAAAEAAGVDPSDWRAAFLAGWNGSEAGDDDRQTVRSSRAPPPAEVADATGMPTWDASTATGEAGRTGPPESARLAAEEMLRSNPGLAEKHSVKSLAAAVAHAGTKGESKLSKLADESQLLPPLKLVTIHENPRVADKPIDVSNLPYLHRNPAV